jgi:primosomal protein N' (replication factor Y)
MLDFTRKVADYYLCPWGEILAAAYPAHAQRSWRASSDSAPVLSAHIDSGTESYPGHAEAELVEYLNPLLRASREEDGRVFLLHLPDEIRERLYPFLASEMLRAGGSVLFLIPEVSTSYSLIELLRERFGQRMALFHSRLRISERKRIWEHSREGTLKILVGTRSAVFLPIPNLRLVVVEDEHARPFKQEETPRYNARDVAMMRGELARAPVVLASATPSVESVLAAERGISQLLKGIPISRTKPEVNVVDMRREENLLQGSGELSSFLVSKIRSNLEEGKRALLFLNRRGFSTWVQCRECGSVEKCPMCELPLVFHSRDKSLLCHHCGCKEEAPSSCSRCGGTQFRFGGVGVEKVHARLDKLFPEACVARVDLDSFQGRPEAVNTAKQFADGKIDILIGTVFVLKGFELGKFSVAGMLHAESPLNIPDFRSGERSFQLLSEVVSLAHRSGAETVIETLNPDHHSVVSVCESVPRRFYERELEERQELGYPPFSALIAFHIAGAKEPDVVNVVERVRTCASEIARSGDGEVQILGPSPAIPVRVRGRFRWYASIRGKDREAVRTAARSLLEQLGGKHEIAGVTISVDVDPAGA